MRWKSIRLGDVFLFIRNGASIKQEDGKSGVPITRIETIATGNVDETKLGYADVNGDQFSDYYLQENDILMSHINSWIHLGKCALVPKQDRAIVHGMNLLLLRPNNELIDAGFIKHYFSTINFKSQLHKISNQSVNQSSFAVTKLKELSLSLPPLSTQQKIAAMLDVADTLRRKDKALLAKYDELLQAVFYDMFGDPVKNEMGWEVGVIRDIVTEVKYGTSKPAEDSGLYPYLRMNNITYTGDWDFASMKYINLANGERDKYLVRKGDLVFNRTNSRELVGKTAVYDSDKEMAIAGYLIRVRTNERANPNYVSMYLNSKHGKKTLMEMCKSIIGMANINAQELQEIKVMIPPIDLQNEFASIYKEIQHLKSQIIQQQTYSENLFQSLMQRAFKGELAG